MRALRTLLVLPGFVATIVACGGGSYSGGTATGGSAGSGGPGGGSGGGSGGQFANSEEFFAARVQPNLAFCRTCHIPGGVADTSEGRRFMLSSSPAQDYAKLQASWEALGGGVENNLILVKSSHSDPAISHSGGYPWPQGSVPYEAMRVLLQCWDDPDGCPALLGNVGGGGSGGGELPPLLGNPGKHYFVNRICDNGKTPADADFYTDPTPIDWSQDPRRMLTPDGGLIDSEQYAVHFNDPFEICHNDTLFENQAEQNALREQAGEEPIYTAKPYAKTCGEWRARVQEGHDWIAMWPTDTVCGKDGLQGDSCGGQGTGLAAGFSSTSATAWNNLWKVWGLSERPANYDRQISERYGHSPAPAHIPNPYPVIDAATGVDERTELSETFGGTGRLPLGYAQGRDEGGRYNGNIGLNCFSCHAGQIGAGEIAGRDGIGNAQSYGANNHGSFMGLPNTNTELGVLIADLLHADQYTNLPGAEQFPLRPPAAGYVPLVNTTRGTNAADTEIEAIVIVRDFDTLEFSHVLTDPLHGNMGDQDPPAWWWLHNKTRYLWFGGHSTDSSRGNMYFGSVNGLSGEEVKRNEGIFESVHDWSLSVEAPSYPGDVDTALAEQGAILFHEKDLWNAESWAPGTSNTDIPRPKGNGACAGCHGAYSPRYANDTRFLPDPKLAGTTGYTVPIEIIDTDPAQAEGWAATVRPHVSTFWWSYPDANPDYLFPEHKDPLTELVDDYAFTDGASGPNFFDQLGRNFDRLGLLQPLHELIVTLGAQTNPLTGIPLGENLGRVAGACGFEEKTVGYVTPPLHGVWASAPYFHNGSVPTVWYVLKPEARPKVWRRQSKTTPDMLVNAFAHELTDNADTGEQGAYDFERLGWQHDVLICDDGGQGVPYYHCQGPQDAPPEIEWATYTALGGLLWPTWVVPPPVGAQGLEDRKIMNSNLYSKRNGGHEFTQVLTDQERLALIEYLKTL